MKVQWLIFFFLVIKICTNAQCVDTIIATKAYTSYYSFELKNPLMVTYTLYHGGGECDRSNFSFKDKWLGHKGATMKDYSKSGYDKGHLANAEDFAYDCILDESTFRFWNCYPQTPKLNRGIWKALEEKVRKISQTDSLLILCGGFYNSNATIGDNIAIPTSCWKVVYSYTKQRILFSYIFTNDSLPVSSRISVEELNNMLKNKYEIDIHKLLR